jgi:large conductance mechanosensitive channel
MMTITSDDYPDDDQDDKKTKKQSEKIVITGGKLRLEAPSTKTRHKSLRRTLVVESADEVVDGFVSFLKEYAVVGLAIGFVIGLQAQTLVKQLVESFIEPLFKLFFGQALTQHVLTLHFRGNLTSITWGAFAYSLLNFLFVLGAIYLIVKLFKLDKLKKVEEVEEME